MFKKIFIIAECEWKVLVNSKASLVGQFFVEPIAYVIFLGAGIQGVVHVIQIPTGISVPYLSFLYPGILCVLMVRLFARMIYRITVERRWGLYALKRISGIGPASYLIGISIVPLSIFLFQSVIIIPLSIFLGGQLIPVNLCLTLLLGTFFLFFWICLATLTTIAIKNYQQRDLIVNLSMLPLMFSAPLFYPLENAPRYLVAISHYNPLTWHVAGLRSILFDKSWIFFSTLSLLLVGVAFLLTIIVLKYSELLVTEH